MLRRTAKEARGAGAVAAALFSLLPSVVLIASVESLRLLRTSLPSWPGGRRCLHCRPPLHLFNSRSRAFTRQSQYPARLNLLFRVPWLRCSRGAAVGVGPQETLLCTGACAMECHPPTPSDAISTTCGLQQNAIHPLHRLALLDLTPTLLHGVWRVHAGASYEFAAGAHCTPRDFLQ